MGSKIAWMIAAEPGWRALFGIDDEEVGRSRLIGWAEVQDGDETSLVGIIVDPNDPAQLVPAPEVIDPSGGELMRYGFSA